MHPTCEALTALRVSLRDLMGDMDELHRINTSRRRALMQALLLQTRRPPADVGDEGCISSASSSAKFSPIPSPSARIRRPIEKLQQNACELPEHSEAAPQHGPILAPSHWDQTVIEECHLGESIQVKGLRRCNTRRPSADEAGIQFQAQLAISAIRAERTA
mmetsp:Transcript_112973/g.319533  ORF Transcript_112973/g.319533 Transcript_112973/m.319533 type:complete len:161 (-) Transcript_112973:177-659(-)